MHPVLLEFGGLRVGTYGLFMALGSGFGVWLGYRLYVRQERFFTPDGFWNELGRLLVLGFGGAKLLYLIQFAPRLGEPGMLKAALSGGFAFHGAFLVPFAFYWVHHRRIRRSFWGLGDRLMPILALGHAVGRVGCFFAACCHGAPCDLPWAVSFTHPLALVAPALRGVPVHPVQLYDALGEVALGSFLLVYALPKARAHEMRAGAVPGFWSDGALMALYMLGYGVLRFLLEFVRADVRGGFDALGLTSYQWISVAGVAAGAWLLANPAARWRLMPYPLERV